MDHKQQKLRAIQLIDDCNNEVSKLLEHAPILQANATSALTRLANGLRTAAGAIADSNSQPKPEELTHIAGMPIGKAKDKKLNATPSAKAVNDVNMLAEQVIADLRSGASLADVMEKHSALAIRAAAVLIGMSATSTYPEQVTGAFVAEIYNRIVDQDELNKQLENAKLGAEELADLKKREATAIDENDAALTGTADDNSNNGIANAPDEAAKTPEGGIAASLDMNKTDNPDAVDTNKAPAEYKAFKAAELRLNEAKQAVIDAEKAKENLPIEASTQQKGAITRAINAAKAEQEIAQLSYNEAKAALDKITG